MKTVVLGVRKSEVYDEVALTTSYVGKKMLSGEDKGAYERIFTTDGDRLQLERFWHECCAELSSVLKPFLVELGSQPESDGVDLGRNYEVVLELPMGYDERLNSSLEGCSYSYFVEGICGRWFRLSNKGESDSYLGSARSTLDKLRGMLYHRQRPRRVVPGGG